MATIKNIKNISTILITGIYKIKPKCMQKESFITSTQAIIDMYRRFRRRNSAQRVHKKVIQHTTAGMAQVQVTNAQHVFIIANAGALANVGTSAVTAIYGLSNREQEYSVDSELGRTTIDIGFSDITSDGTYEYVVWKRERQPLVPIVGAGLPSNADATSTGLQQSYRLEMPGRVYRFGKIALSKETPRVLKITMNWKKFKAHKIKSGDFYGITFFNRTGASVTMDFETRTKELI